MSRLPLLSWREVVKVLAKAGFQVARQKGSHLILIKDEYIVTELLLKSYDSEFLQLILWSNEERKKRRLRMKPFMQKLRRLVKEQKFFKRS